ncbi:SusC/RagA family TonB-linked outer membrane protein [Flavobacterium branchiarum]|uniref:SusC/RagA family TonB-linked outer membrane protein n=2 Tax=Flavobacterium branchiarum TaxID=1114870 RepID=A0ABV5FJX2_9FLAO
MVLCFLFIGVTHAQKNVFKGKILDATTKKGIDAAFITVLVSGDSYFTNEKGEFEIPNLFHSSVIITQQGYESLEVKLLKDVQTLYLKPSLIQLEEIVIRRSKNINDIDVRNLTGSVVTVDMAKLSERSELDMAKLLQGQVPGLTVTYSGELGKKPEIRLRGNSSFSYKGAANEPLFVMDGIIISTETFLTLNPNDFSSIKVLKDAPATALYGIKAANGVIELTSKRGFNGKATISYSMKQGITMRGERPVEMMDTDEKLAFEEKIGIVGRPGFDYSEANIRKSFANSPLLQQKLEQGAFKLDSLRQYNTDWFKELIKPNHFQSHNLSIRGGTEKSAYFYSVNYSKQGGRIPGNDINHITARANLDYTIAPTFQLSFNNSFGVSTTNTENGMTNDPTELVYSLNPYETKETKQLISYPNRSYNDLINQFKDKTTNKRFSSSVVMHWDILPELNIAGVVGADYSINEIYQRIYSSAYSQINKKENEKGFLSESDTKNFNYSTNIRANYQKKIGDHDLFLGFNVDYYLTDIKSISGSGHGISDDVSSLSGINSSFTNQFKPSASGSKMKNNQLGFGVAGGYTYQGIYDFYASLKRDGSSLLPSDKRWNDAWSAGLGWSPSEYEFFKKQTVLTSVKFRTSMGYTASMTGILPRDIATTYSNSNTFYGDYRVLQLAALPNKELQPQQTYSNNFSVDLGFINRFNLLVSLYKDVTKEAILAMPIATSNGFATYTKNIGELENRGVEFTVNGDLLALKTFRWNTGISISYNANKVKKLYGTDRIYTGNQSVTPDYEVGKPLGILYGLQSNGIHPLTGLPEFIDNKGNVIDVKTNVTSDYMNKLGSTIAPYNGYFNNYFTYKNWSLNVNMSYQLGGKAKFSDTYVRDESFSYKNAVKGQLTDMWFEVGDENKIYPIQKLPSYMYTYNSFPNSKTVYSTDYLKLNYIQLGYRFTENSFIDRYFKSLQINIQADNLYTFRIEKNRGSLNDVIQPILTLSLNATF